MFIFFTWNERRTITSTLVYSISLLKYIKHLWRDVTPSWQFAAASVLFLTPWKVAFTTLSHVHTVLMQYVKICSRWKHATVSLHLMKVQRCANMLRTHIITHSIAPLLNKYKYIIHYIPQYFCSGLFICPWFISGCSQNAECVQRRTWGSAEGTQGEAVFWGYKDKSIVSIVEIIIMLWWYRTIHVFLFYCRAQKTNDRSTPNKQTKMDGVKSSRKEKPSATLYAALTLCCMFCIWGSNVDNSKIKATEHSGDGDTTKPMKVRVVFVFVWRTDGQTHSHLEGEVIAGKREDNNANWHFRNEMPVAVATGHGLGSSAEGVRMGENGWEGLQRPVIESKWCLIRSAIISKKQSSISSWEEGAVCATNSSSYRQHLFRAFSGVFTVVVYGKEKLKRFPLDQCKHIMSRCFVKHVQRHDCAANCCLLCFIDSISGCSRNNCTEHFNLL